MYLGPLPLSAVGKIYLESIDPAGGKNSIAIFFKDEEGEARRMSAGSRLSIKVVGVYESRPAPDSRCVQVDLESTVHASC